MKFTQNPYIVYVKTNSQNYISAIDSSAFLKDTSGWLEIDSGYGDKYHHAQGNYFPESIFATDGVYRYKLVDDKPVESTDEEIAQQKESYNKAPIKNHEERIAMLESQNELLTQCILELSEQIFA